MYKFLPYLVFILILTGVSTLQASHLAGGELTYQCLGKNANGLNRYRINFVLYRDCSSASNVNFDAQVSIYAFRVSDQGLTDSLILNSFVADTLSLSLNDTCAELPPGLCYARARYSGILDLPDNNFGYDLSWSRCCRNNSIVNITNPAITGTTLTVRIPPTALCDNSPEFNSEPGLALCLGLPYSFMNTATDADGDSIAYELLTPYMGGSTTDPIPVPQPPPFTGINWNPPYNLTNILGGNPGLSVDAQTGRVSVNPDINGQFAVCIGVKSYRAGTLLTEVRRDYQLNVVVCQSDIPPVLGVPQGPEVNNKELIFYAGMQNCYTFQISDDASNFVVFTAEGDIFNPDNGNVASYNGAGYGTVEGRLCWAPDCAQAGFTGNVFIAANDNNNCPGPNYIRDTFQVRVIPPPVPSPLLRCVSDMGNNSVRLNWITTGDVPGFTRYDIFKSTLSTPETLISSITDSTQKTWTDAAAGPYSDAPAYRIQTYYNCPDNNPGQITPALALLIPNVHPNSPVQAEITWPTYTGWENPLMDIWKTSGNIKIAEAISGNVYQYTDCDYTGSFRLESTDPVSACQMISAPGNEIRMYLDPPDTLRGCTASVLPDNTGVEVRWNQLSELSGFQPALFRKNPGESEYRKIHDIPAGTLSYTDTEAFPDEGEVHYQLAFLNPCGNLSGISPEFHTFFLQTESLGSAFRLNWTIPSLDGGVSEYEVQVREYESKNSAWLVKMRQATDAPREYRDEEILTSREEYCYRIRAYALPGQCALETWSNTRCERPLPGLEMPTGFTPNGDGVNDFYRIPTFAVKNISFSIYDHWGNLVYISRDKYAVWDGSVNGKACPEGIYLYFLQAEGYTGQSIQKNGTITLIR